MNRTLLLLLLTTVGLTGCARRAANPSTADAAARPPPTVARDRDAAAPPALDDTEQALAALRAAPIYFTLDSSSLPPEAGDELTRIAQALRQRSIAKVTVSGHTCELGTTEYNVALGQRRAASVRAYLMRLGVEPERISVVSYGEERPADVDAPAKNRRAEFSFRLSEQAHAGEL
ncbi:OmpA family protein [Corallococcus sp. bb12-1]|uniref:OmpA family protein n=1 Tax=Corallococcus sp. bb12-1 TaxID=2996784 RepID=UPI0022712FA7|nr:OmpA family protein [Corallococcus sp. bb12-1]MCY1046052.1 OmpA family protein [Corallococcus sp. bb12-1]